MTKKFLIKSLLPYKKGTKPFGYDGLHCVYLTDYNNTCAIGQYMKPGPWQYRTGGVQTLFLSENEQNIMTDEWLKQKVPIKVAMRMQGYHDTLSRHGSVHHIVEDLEKLTGFKLPELL